MMRISLLVYLFFAAVFAGFGQTLPPDEANAAKALLDSPRHGEWVSYEANKGDMVQGYVVYPERKDKAPVVIVIHEIFGLTDWARGVADALAKEGFIAIAPDFLSGKAADGKGGSKEIGPDGSRAAIGKLAPEEILARLDGAAKYATALPSAKKEFGVVGFCWGGGISFAWATKNQNLGASVVYYGTSPNTDTLKGIKAPVLGLYGGNDARVNATIPAAQEELKKLGKTYDVHIYDGAGHAFLRQLTGQNGANQKAADQGWPTTIAFLKKHLKDATKSSYISPKVSDDLVLVGTHVDNHDDHDDCGDECLAIVAL